MRGVNLGQKKDKMKESKNEEAQFRAMYDQYLSWKQSQARQEDAYEFERSFDMFCQQMNRQMLEMASQDNRLAGKKKFTPSSAK